MSLLDSFDEFQIDATKSYLDEMLAFAARHDYEMETRFVEVTRDEGIRLYGVDVWTAELGKQVVHFRCPLCGKKRHVSDG